MDTVLRGTVDSLASLATLSRVVTERTGELRGPETSCELFELSVVPPRFAVDGGLRSFNYW